jgi:GMP synthase (glutamine-hydrolysing)
MRREEGDTMILVLDMCYRAGSLSRYEFVDPVATALRRAGAEIDIMHYGELDDPGGYDKIVLCGTALKDMRCLDYASRLSWIRKCKRPVLGISTGAAVLCHILGGRLLKDIHIGMEDVRITAETPLLGEPRTIHAFHLHGFRPVLPSELMAAAENCEAFVSRYRPVYGLLFNPEVRNCWILERFVRCDLR